jgi:hypothetical protein
MAANKIIGFFPPVSSIIWQYSKILFKDYSQQNITNRLEQLVLSIEFRGIDVEFAIYNLQFEICILSA